MEARKDEKEEFQLARLDLGRVTELSSGLSTRGACFVVDMLMIVKFEFPVVRTYRDGVCGDLHPIFLLKMLQKCFKRRECPQVFLSTRDGEAKLKHKKIKRLTVRRNRLIINDENWSQ